MNELRMNNKDNKYEQGLESCCGDSYEKRWRRLKNKNNNENTKKVQ